MKRVLLREPQDLGRTNLAIVRQAAVALATYAVDGPHGRKAGDPVHEEVTEGRRAQYERAVQRGDTWAVNMAAGYSSCGDLAHWLLRCLGVRDERWINRSDDYGDIPWMPTVNLDRLVRSPWYVAYQPWTLPALGDILHVRSPDHVAVLTRVIDSSQWVTCDYGQPHGLERVCQLRDVPGGLQVRGRRLVGWVSLRRVVELGALVESAIVPSSFEGGTPDDNPYPEDLRIPEGL